MQLVFIKKESSIDILTSYHICELVDSECVGVQSLCSSLVVCLYVIWVPFPNFSSVEGQRWSVKRQSIQKYKTAHI